MIDHDDRITVAVSGGKDSISLLHMMNSYQQNHWEFSLSAITVDEGIQNYREEAIEIATQNCQSQKIEHHTISFKEIYGKTLDEIVFQLKKKKESRLTPCAYCGVLRRQALNIAARKVKAIKVAKLKGLSVIALTGKDGGKMAGLADVEIRVPHFGFADRIQEVHIKIIHILIYLIEKKMA